MKCANCNSDANEFPTYPEMFSDLHLGWCMPCISEDNRLRYKLLQSRGVFIKLRDLMNAKESGKITESEFETENKALFAM